MNVPVEIWLLSIGRFLNGQDFSNLLRTSKTLWDTSRKSPFQAIVNDRYHRQSERVSYTQLSAILKQEMVHDLPHYKMTMVTESASTSPVLGLALARKVLTITREDMAPLTISEEATLGVYQHRYLYKDLDITLIYPDRPGDVASCCWRTGTDEVHLQFVIVWQLKNSEPSINRWSLLGFEGHAKFLFSEMAEINDGDRLIYNHERSFIEWFVDENAYIIDNQGGIYTNVRSSPDDFEVGEEESPYIEPMTPEKIHPVLHRYGLPSGSDLYHEMMKRMLKFQPKAYYCALRKILQPWLIKSQTIDRLLIPNPEISAKFWH